MPPFQNTLQEILSYEKKERETLETFSDTISSSQKARFGSSIADLVLKILIELSKSEALINYIQLSATKTSFLKTIIHYHKIIFSSQKVKLFFEN